MLGSGVGPGTDLFVSCFGPRGLASILYVFLVRERVQVAGRTKADSLQLSVGSLRRSFLMKKRRHHYVWQYYLKAWCVDGLITCLRQGHRFKTGTPNVAIKTDFYRLCEFSEQYLDAVKQLCMRNSSQELQAIQQGWVDIFRLPFRLRKQAEEARGKDPAVDKLFDEILNNLEEDLHAHLEAGSIPHLDALRNGDLSFLDSDADAASFFHFIAVQYLRTDKIRTATIANTQGCPLV